MDLPVLKIRRAQGDDALLKHKLNDDEKKLFKEMDTATGELPEDTDLEDYHRLVSEIGAKYGLSKEQSIAFWTRTTFMVFEA
jgi:hypothetical protein